MGKLDLLRVDHDHPHLIGRGAQQDGADDAIDAAALAGAGRAGDEHVHHTRQVSEHGLAGDVLAQPEGQRRCIRREGAVDVAETDEVGLHVRHLDAHRLLAGDRRLHADVGRGQRICQVVLERSDAIDLDPRRELQFVTCHARSGDRIDDPCVDAEVTQSLPQPPRNLLDRRRCLAVAFAEAPQQRRIGQCPLAAFADGERQSRRLAFGRLGSGLGQRQLSGVSGGLVGLIFEVGRTGVRRMRRHRGRTAAEDLRQLAGAVDETRAVGRDGETVGVGRRFRPRQARVVGLLRELFGCGALAFGGSTCGFASRPPGGGNAAPRAARPQSERRARHQQETGDRASDDEHVRADAADQRSCARPKRLADDTAVAAHVRHPIELTRPCHGEHAEAVCGRSKEERDAEQREADTERGRRPVALTTDQKHANVDEHHRRQVRECADRPAQRGRQPVPRQATCPAEIQDEHQEHGDGDAGDGADLATVTCLRSRFGVGSARARWSCRARAPCPRFWARYSHVSLFDGRG